MLPDFPDQKGQFIELTERMFLARIRADPLLSLFPPEPILEGATIRMSAESGYDEANGLEDIEHQFDLSVDDIMKHGHTVYLEKLWSLADETVRGMAGLVQSKISETTERTGNSIDLGGADLKEEHILDMYRNLEIAFDENDQPDFSTGSIFAHPDNAPVLERLVENIKTIPRYRREFDRVIEQKRREWHARENHRKLVD